MKITQVSEHIFSLRSSLVLFPIHVWLVTDEKGVTLVDAGMPFMTKGILAHIEQLNAGSLQRILLTHGHADHVGAVQTLVDHYQVPVYAHEKEIPYMEGDLLYPRRKKFEHNVAKGLAQPFQPTETGEFPTFAGLTPYFTPGHSPGHVVYYHEQDQVLLAGDLLTSKRGKLHRPMPMFTADMAEALQSSTLLQKIKPRRVEVCHGAPVFNPADHLDDYLTTTAAKFSVAKPVL